MNESLFWFTDEQWAKVKPHLPTNQPGPERKDEDDRRIYACAEIRLSLERLSE